MAVVQKTWTVESRGVGLPDYSAPAPVGQIPKPTTYTLSDMSELAARLGSPVTFDRRGDIIWLDDFENGLGGWSTIPSGVGANVGIFTTTKRTGSSSCRLRTGSTIGDATTMYRFLSYPIIGRLGFELSFTYPLVSGPIYTWGLILSEGTIATTHSAYMRYNTITEVLDIFTNGVWLYIATKELAQTIFMFHFGKIVADFENNKYTRLILDDRKYDVSAYDLAGGVPLFGWPYLVIMFSVESQSAGNKDIYVDDVIVTQNEPINV